MQLLDSISKLDTVFTAPRPRAAAPRTANEQPLQALPRWARPQSPDPGAAIFAAGAGFALLDALLRGPDGGEPVFAGCLRQRLALKAADSCATLARLRLVPGVGEWTAQYIAMRALAWPDAFPHTDLGVMKALSKTNARDALAAAEAWRPWRAYATAHLWATLGDRGRERGGA